MPVSCSLKSRAAAEITQWRSERSRNTTVPLIMIMIEDTDARRDTTGAIMARKDARTFILRGWGLFGPCVPDATVLAAQPKPRPNASHACRYICNHPKFGSKFAERRVFNPMVALSLNINKDEASCKATLETRPLRIWRMNMAGNVKSIWPIRSCRCRFSLRAVEHRAHFHKFFILINRRYYVYNGDSKRSNLSWLSHENGIIILI